MPAPVFQGAQVILHSGAAIRGPLRCHYYCQEFTEVNLHQMIFFQTLYGSIAKNDCPIYIYTSGSEGDGFNKHCDFFQTYV